MLSFSENSASSIVKYLDYMDRLIQSIVDIYYQFSSPFVFAKWLCKKEIYSNPSAPQIEGILFRTKDMLGMRITVIRKLEKIIQVYEKENKK